MNKFWGRFVHGVAVAGTLFAQFGGLVPAKYAGPVALGISVAQAVVGAVQHKNNEDGTPQAEPFKVK